MNNSLPEPGKIRVIAEVFALLALLFVYSLAPHSKKDGERIELWD